MYCKSCTLHPTAESPIVYVTSSNIYIYIYIVYLISIIRHCIFHILTPTSDIIYAMYRILYDMMFLCHLSHLLYSMSHILCQLSHCLHHVSYMLSMSPFVCYMARVVYQVSYVTHSNYSVYVYVCIYARSASLSLSLSLCMFICIRCAVSRALSHISYIRLPIMYNTWYTI